ncbi:MAG: hypothetical protein IID28_04075 [Planctomycetes bacterium]|nr:hypothetical protein [Planctomycetota bacterium]
MDRARLETDSRLAMIAGPVVILAMVGWLAGFGGPDASAGGAEAAWILLTSTPWALGWLLAAVGLGWPLRCWLLGCHPDALAIQVGLGVAAMMVLDAGLGALGVLQWGGSIGAWALIVIGLGLLTRQLRLASRTAPVLPLLAWTAVPAVAVLLVAACSAPGWLWASEFGGYDALSYHLQLPSEWQANGRIVPLEHNVYSWLPGYVEAAYYHLMVLIGDGLGAVYACQLLHAMFALLTAAIAGRVAWRYGGPLAGAVAAVVIVGTPWVVVVGSLGYNEMAVTLLLAAGLLVVGDESIDTPGAAGALGILVAAACGAKLTAVGFVAAPLALLLLVSTRPQRRLLFAAVAAGSVLVCLGPWLVRNGAYSGNPLFPFATGVLGLGHWTADQAGSWSRGHAAGTGFAGRVGAIWHQVFRYGLGANPDPTEPWLPQWSLLPWLAIAGLAVSAARTPWRRPALRIGLVLAVQLVFWIGWTHLKSRFMVPAVVPGALAVAVGVAAVADRLRAGTLMVVMGVMGVMAALLWCCLPGAIYLREADGAPAARIGMARIVSAVALPSAATVLLVGDATPLYYRGDVAYQTTWDRGPLSSAMRASPDDPAAWLDDLREKGFTHILVAPRMLRIWQGSGWNDPLITAERVIDAADRYAILELVSPGGERLYRLR